MLLLRLLIGLSLQNVVEGFLIRIVGRGLTSKSGLDTYSQIGNERDLKDQLTWHTHLIEFSK